MKVLAETSTLIEYLKGNSKAKYYLENAEDIYISSLSIFEILLGKVKEQDILDFLSAFKVLSFTRRDSIVASRIYKELKNKGKLVGVIDILLSSQAINKRLTLLTKDSDFLKIKDEFSEINIIILSN